MKDKPNTLTVTIDVKSLASSLELQTAMYGYFAAVHVGGSAALEAKHQELRTAILRSQAAITGTAVK